MTLTEARGRLNALATELSTLGRQAERTEEQDARLDAVIAEFNDLAPQVERLASVQAATQRAEGMQQSAGRVSGVVAPEGSEQLGAETPAPETVDRRGVGERFATSDAVREWLRHGGRRSRGVEMGAIDARAVATPSYGGAEAGQGPVQRHALIETGVLPAFMVPPMVVPGIFRPRDQALAMREVIINGRTSSDTIYFLRELAFTNAAAETAQATATGGASGTKPESSLTFEQADAAVKTIAHWIPITRQAIADAVQLQTYVENRLLVGLERRVNGQIANGDGTGENLLGILNTSGVQALDAAYFAANPTKNVGTDAENFDRIVRGQTEIELTGDAQATFVALNPRDIERFQTTTDANNQFMAGGPFAAGGVRTLWGMPLARERAIPVGTALVGDGTMAAIWDREDAQILIDTINDQFIRNMLTILAELRAALTVFRPAAFAEVALVA